MADSNGPSKKLYRIRENRMLAGVCSGIGEYTNIDPTVIRLIFVLAGLMTGWGVLAYIILALVMPEK
jgi:phage shock protein PspC (stress-responsive transcriptional regulator)